MSPAESPYDDSLPSGLGQLLPLRNHECEIKKKALDSRNEQNEPLQRCNPSMYVRLLCRDILAQNAETPKPKQPVAQKIFVVLLDLHRIRCYYSPNFGLSEVRGFPMRAPAPVRSHVLSLPGLAKGTARHEKPSPISGPWHLQETSRTN